MWPASRCCNECVLLRELNRDKVDRSRERLRSHRIERSRISLGVGRLLGRTRVMVKSSRELPRSPRPAGTDSRRGPWWPRESPGLHRSVRGMVLSARDRGVQKATTGGVPRAAEEREKKSERREGEMYKWPRCRWLSGVTWPWLGEWLLYCHMRQKKKNGLRHSVWR